MKQPPVDLHRVAPPPKMNRADGTSLLRLGGAAIASLVLIARHDRLSPEDWIMRAVARRADEIGVAALLDFESGEPCPDGRAGEEPETRNFAGPLLASRAEGAPAGPRKGADGRSALRAAPGRGDQS